MLSLEFELLTGKFHATPWGRHVNEGAIEWPPSPWRLHRALVSGWQLALPDEPADHIEALLRKLASSAPSFHLPPSSSAHTRHYVPTPKGSRLLLDAFVVVERGGGPVVAIWPDLLLEEEEVKLLDRLLRGVRYLGRTESMCRVQRTEREWSINAYPLAADIQSNADLTTLLCPTPEATLAQYWMTTTELRKAGWSFPPGSQWVTYKVQPTLGPAHQAPVDATATFLTYWLGNQAPLPRSQTLLLADRFRRRLLQEQPLSPTLSGKDGEVARQDGHRHLHILPDGLLQNAHLDRLILWAPEGFSDDDLRTLTRLRQIPIEKDCDHVDLLVARVSREDDPSSATVWKSFTPYLSARRSKPNGRDSLEEQIATECQRRGLPVPIISRLDVDMPRYRIRRGPRPRPVGQPEWLRLEFPHDIHGPLCLGTSSHFGMGRFKPTEL